MVVFLHHRRSLSLIIFMLTLYIFGYLYPHRNNGYLDIGVMAQDNDESTMEALNIHTDGSTESINPSYTPISTDTSTAEDHEEEKQQEDDVPKNEDEEMVNREELHEEETSMEGEYEHHDHEGDEHRDHDENEEHHHEHEEDHHDHDEHDHHEHDHDHEHEHEHHEHDHEHHEHDHEHHEHDHEHHEHDHEHHQEHDEQGHHEHHEHDHEHNGHDHEHHDHHEHDHEHNGHDEEEHHDHEHHHHDHEHHHHDHEHHHHDHEHGHEHHDHDEHDHHEHDHDHADHHHDHAHHDHADHHHDHAHHDHADHHHEHHHHDHDHSSSASNFDKVLSDHEKHPLTAITLTFVSGMAATLGGLFVICLGEPSPKFLAHLLSFAAGIMLYISYGDLLPHAIEDMDSGNTDTHHHHHSSSSHDHGHGEHSHGPGLFEANIWMFGGMVFFLSISFLVHKLGGNEDDNHGHNHSHAHNHPSTSATTDTKETKKETKESSGTKTNEDNDKNTQNTPSPQPVPVVSPKKSSSTGPIDKKKLMMTGIMAAIGITLHNLPEGLIVYNQTITGVCNLSKEIQDQPDWWNHIDISQCLTRGVAITMAIALHNIPEGMAVASPIYASTGSRWEAFKYTFLSSIAEPLAAIIFGVFFSSQLTRHMMACLNATVAGIMICLCLTDLMPAAAQVVSPKEAAVSNVLGQLAMFLSLHFMRAVGAH